MKLTLNISDENVLKGEIKALVVATIKNMAREEAEKILKEELTRILEAHIKNEATKYCTGINQKIELILTKELTNTIKFELHDHPLLGNSNYIKDTVSDKINQILKSKDLDTMIFNAVQSAKTEAIKKLLGEK